MDSTWKVWGTLIFDQNKSEASRNSFWKFILENELVVVTKTMKLSKEGEISAILNLDRSAKSSFGSLELFQKSILAARHQLQCLSPLSDHLGLREYRKAVEKKTCFGFQPIVYGLFFEAYSIPIRQGLSYYADQYRHNVPELFRPSDGWSNLLTTSINQVISESLKDAPLIRAL